MGDAFEILFDVVVVTSMVLLVRLYKKDSQPLRAAFFSFCFSVEVEAVGKNVQRTPLYELHSNQN